MTASISYFNEGIFPGGLTVDDPLVSILEEWEQSGLSGTHPDNPGGFYGGSVFSGTTYAYNDASLGYSFSITAAAGSTLNYDFPTHTLTGSIATVTIGAGLSSTGTVTAPLFTFTFDAPLVGTVEEGRANVVHDVIWGLMNGSVHGADSSSSTSQGGLVAALEENGLDTDLSVAQLTGSSAFAESELLLAA